MQSLEVLQNLAYVDRELIEQRCRRLFDCYARSDVEEAMKLFAPGATVVFPRRSRTRADSGRHVGLAAIRNVFGNLVIEYEIFGQEIHSVLIDRDQAVVYRVIKARLRGTGRASTLISNDWLTFQDGLIMRLECVTRVVDTF